MNPSGNGTAGTAPLRISVIGVVAFAGAATLGFALGWLFGARVGMDDLLQSLAALSIPCGVGVTWFVATADTEIDRSGVGLGLVWLTIAAVALGNSIGGWIDLLGFGDAGFLGAWLDTRDGPFSHWLGASAISGWIFDVGWRSEALAGVVPAGQAGADLFVLVSGILVMTGCAVGLALFYGRRRPLTVVFCLFSPVYLMFSLGYDEVYPLVAGPFVIFLFWLFSRPLDQHSGALIGLWLGGLVVLYPPFVMPAAAIGIGVLLLRPRKLLQMALTGSTTALTGVWIFWPQGVRDFFVTFHADLNLGDKHTLFPRYHGRASGPDSIYLDWRYAVSSEHIADLTYMWFWAGAMVPLVVALISVVVIVRNRTAGAAEGGSARIFGLDVGPWFARRRVRLAMILVVQQAHWVLFVIPKLGPRGDLDLFFPAYLLAAFLCGTALELLLKSVDHRKEHVVMIAATFIGAASAALILLVIVGVPPSYL